MLKKFLVKIVNFVKNTIYAEISSYVYGLIQSWIKLEAHLDRFSRAPQIFPKSLRKIFI